MSEVHEVAITEYTSSLPRRGLRAMVRPAPIPLCSDGVELQADGEGVLEHDWAPTIGIAISLLIYALMWGLILWLAWKVGLIATLV